MAALSMAASLLSRARLPQLVLGLLLASPTAIAQQNYTQVDMLQTQLELLGARGKDCPPWYGLFPIK